MRNIFLLHPQLYCFASQVGLLQQVIHPLKRYCRVEYHAHLFVLANKDAPLCVLSRVANVYQHAIRSPSHQQAFQFHKGTIETCQIKYSNLHIEISFEFQFHKGTIETYLNLSYLVDLPISIP